MRAWAGPARDSDGRGPSPRGAWRGAGWRTGRAVPAGRGPRFEGQRVTAARFPGGGRPDAPARRLAAPPFDRVGDGRHVMDLSASSEQSRWGGRYPRAARRSGAVTQQVAVSDSGLGGPDLSESLRCESLPLHSGRTAGGGGQQAGAPLGGLGTPGQH